MYEDGDDIITDDSCTKSEGRRQKFFKRICTKYKPDLTIHSLCYAWKKRTAMTITPLFPARQVTQLKLR